MSEWFCPTYETQISDNNIHFCTLTKSAAKSVFRCLQILCLIGNPKIWILRSNSRFPNRKHPQVDFGEKEPLGS